MSLTIELFDGDRYSCQKPIPNIKLEKEPEVFLKIEPLLEKPDQSEKSRLVQAFNKSHQKPGFKVSR